MLKVSNLCKTYPTFSLKDVSFELPKGYIMGFIGENGAGKTTTLKSILNFVKPDSGEISIFGLNMKDNELEIKSRIGFMLGEADYYPKTKIKKIAEVYKSFFKNWNEQEYRDYLRRFSIDDNKMISELSTGMRVKLAMTFALSHEAELLFLDEPTSGLDPIARNELLELFHEIIESGEKSILFSTHITSDLDKCADFIIFIRNGELVANMTKDELISSHVLVAGKKEQLTESLICRMIGYKSNPFGFTGLMLKKDFSEEDGLQCETPNLEEIMIYYDKEVAVK